MEKTKKNKVIKTVAIVLVLILVVVGLSPICWRKAIALSYAKYIQYDSNTYGETTEYKKLRVRLIAEEKVWQKYVDEEYTVASFRYSNIEKIEYCDSKGQKTSEYERQFGRGGVMTVHLKTNTLDEAKKAMAIISTLDFVATVWMVVC